MKWCTMIMGRGMILPGLKNCPETYKLQNMIFYLKSNSRPSI
jgi:hypothetical protein